MPIRPVVKVPVLSNITVSILCAVSRGLPPLIIIPKFAPTPVPTMTAVGVARPIILGKFHIPKAQGQATTTTDIEKTSASKNGTKKDQINNVSTARIIIEGTKYPAIQSAKS